MSDELHKDVQARLESEGFVPLTREETQALLQRLAELEHGAFALPRPTGLSTDHDPKVLSVEGHVPAGLLPVRPSLVPLNLHERVALHEAHGVHPGRYGVIRAIGYDPERGDVAIDLLVFDPADGGPIPGEPETVYRATMQEIQ